MYSSIPTQHACVTEQDGRINPLAAVYREGTYPGDTALAMEISLRQRRGLQLMVLHGNSDCSGFAETVTRSLGCPLPVVPNTSAHGTCCDVLWLGPAEWLLAGTIDTEIISHLEAEGALLTDISHGRVIVRIEGNEARNLLAKGCALDLHPRYFRKEFCAQTSIAKVNILLHQIEESIFDIYVGRSYALHFWEWLTASAAEFGYKIASADASLGHMPEY
jgi:sarcosine oxidase subunit gamma